MGKPRNLYKYLKIETWDIGDVMKPREGIVSMEEIERARVQSITSPSGEGSKLDEQEEDGNETDESDRKSKMSFSYWGADKVTLSAPRGKGRPAVRGARRGQVPSSYANRESSAHAKFGSRLVAASEPSSSVSGSRPASRRQQPGVRRTPAPSEEGGASNTSRATMTPLPRPAWSTSTKAGSPIPGANPSSTAISKRTRTLSAGGGQQPPRLQNKPSTAPSEDSGIGLYRQLVAQDPSLKGNQ